MKKIVLLVMVLTLGILFNANAADEIQVNNKLCPISHEAVGAEGMEPAKVTYKGKTYNLCCAMCEGEFNKDPDKHVKMIEEEMKAEESKGM